MTDSTPDRDPVDVTADDPVAALRAEFESITAIPVAERVARFEHANAVLATELAQLDEV